MTKEELEKEARDYALEWGDKTDGTYACCRDGYLAGAEPREKRIAELEKENAELKEKLKPENCLTGLKAGTPEWHSPDEHIGKDKVVLGIIKHCNKQRYSLVQWNGEWWFQYGTYNAEVRLIAWCEIPTYTEE